MFGPNWILKSTTKLLINLVTSNSIHLWLIFGKQFKLRLSYHMTLDCVKIQMSPQIFSLPRWANNLEWKQKVTTKTVENENHQKRKKVNFQSSFI